ncbi:hypothetical protein [Legionella rowbothamii]|uniref:hypothetical protein n=1 Tax=Legionella rowbothamii TaxID=96229 RepID=UPI001054CA11|nr:hypothetical protein [Legionella rowbothamii]
MNDFFDSTSSLQVLFIYLKQQISLSGINTELFPELTNAEQDDASLQDPEVLQEEHAAKCIQHVWTKRQINYKFIQDPYNTYLSMMPADDDQRLLSRIMFGRHAAELPSNSKYKTTNPYIYIRAYYHRDDDLPAVFLKQLLLQFEIDPELESVNEYMPVSLLNNTPIEEIIKNHFPPLKAPIELIKDENHSIGLLVIPRCNFGQILKIKEIVRACGVVASPWEIAQNIKTELYPELISPEIPGFDDLPVTTEELLQSPICKKIAMIATSSRHPTRLLAINLAKLVQALPEMLPEAIKRISLLLELTHTFYEYHYPRYAFCIYVIIHEISLALLKQTDEQFLVNSFNEFVFESKRTFLGSLALSEEQIVNSHFVAFPALSGTNAYTLAMQLAWQMRTHSGAEPKIKVCIPSYYEFAHITKKNLTESDADIYILSAGPIVNKNGLTPGVDINHLVRRKLIGKKREKPLTLIVDATTALYSNLQLAPDVQPLIGTGQLSIILHESHQKFGLIHSDQAQYGRVLGLCAKGSYAEELIHTMQQNSQDDFNRHVDMRIGAFISSICGSSLEEIKQQHFSNGALLRNLLIESLLSNKEVVTHKDMLTNLDQLYFTTSQHSAFNNITRNIIEPRDSFGHFSFTKIGVGKYHRISADASDRIDCLLLASQIYIAQQYTPEQLAEIILIHARGSERLNFEYQIMTLAVLNKISAGLIDLSGVNLLELFLTMHYLLERCSSFSGRQYYVRVVAYLASFEEPLATQYKPANPTHFLNAIKILYQARIKISSLMEYLDTYQHIDLLEKVSTETCLHHFINQHALTQKQLMTVFALLEAQLNIADYLKLICNEKFCSGVLKIHDANQRILMNLKTTPEKYQKASTSSIIYQSECYQALKNYYQVEHSISGAQALIRSLEKAKDSYTQEVLRHDRCPQSQAMRLILMIVTNFFASLTLGAAHAIHYKNTGRIFFFSGTNSENALHATHKDFNAEFHLLSEVSVGA